MTAHYCPDCGRFEVSVRKPGKDGRCDWCRAQVGKRRPYGNPRREQPGMDRIDIALLTGLRTPPGDRPVGRKRHRILASHGARRPDRRRRATYLLRATTRLRPAGIPLPALHTRKA